MKATALQDVSDITVIVLRRIIVMVSWPNKFSVDSGILVLLKYQFYRGVRDFYIKSIPYVWRIIVSCSFFELWEKGFDSIEYFVNRYPFLNGLTIPSEMGLLQEEFVEYELRIFLLMQPGLVKMRMCIIAWTSSGGSYLCKVTATGSSELKFGRLCRVMHQRKSI